MGQRLVIAIRTEAADDTVVNVYKHWSAYTGSAIEETDQFIEGYNQWMDEHPEDKKAFGKNDAASITRQKEIIAIIMMNIWPGAHPAHFHGDVEITDDDDNYAAAVKMFLVANGMPNLAAKLKDHFEYDRNQGLIGITKKGIDNYTSWSEGDVDIYINKDGDIKELYFGVMWLQEWDEAKAEFIENEELDGLTDAQVEAKMEDEIYYSELPNMDDFGSFSIDEWKEFKNICDACWDDGKYKFGSKKSGAVCQFIE